MSVLSREALEASTLADLHEIASGFSIDGYRRLRKADLVDKLIEAQGGDPSEGRSSKSEDAPRQPRSRSREPRQRSDSRGDSRGGGRGDRSDREDRGDRGDSRRRDDRRRVEESPETVEGKLSIHGSGSGFVKPNGGGAEIYVSAAQIRRLELSDGDSIGGPVRSPRRSERHPSLVRIETINGASADSVAPTPPTREKPQPLSLPRERFALGGDATLAEIDRVAPIGRGSRVVFCGGPHSGKSTAIRSLAAALRAIDGVEVFTALAGIRKEEEGDWAAIEPLSTETLDSSPDSRARGVERALDKAKRAISRGGHGVVIVDSVDDLPGAAVRKTLAEAGAKPKGGSLTVVVVSREPIGGETTVVSFDQGRAATGKFPSVDVRNSSTLKPELLLDARGLKAFQKAHADAVKKGR
ncbi:MAG: Rho termination factor N-terminal domain-containing protein [Solirubrobacterales bacterium]|nr:Rho termination factor N-terminal domain-containing protein [Solirubrobacterales bacterium]